MDFQKKSEELLNEKLKSKNMRKHCYAVEAIMRKLAERFGEDSDIWGITGLVHDLDYEETEADLSRHSLVSAKWLEDLGFPPEVVKAVRVHNEMHGFPLESRLERALTFADAISGLVIASALVLPSKKINDLKVKSVIKRFKEKDFARGVNREEVLRCEQEGLFFEEFVELSVGALQGISDKLEL